MKYLSSFIRSLLTPARGAIVRWRCFVLGGLLVLWAPSLWAEDQVLTIEGTRILGDQESPTVLYLIPWQPPEVRLLDRPDSSFMIGRSIKPLERGEFQRLLAYHQRFQAEDAVPGAAADIHN